jgi:hypothetical protein
MGLTDAEQTELYNTGKGKSWPFTDGGYGVDQYVAAQSVFEWFQKPAAVRHVGTYDRTYISWLENSGKIQLRYYDHDSERWGAIVTVDDLLADYGENANDDHNAPMLHILTDGTIQIYYFIHQAADALFMRQSSSPESITSWSGRANIADVGANKVHSYPQVRKLTNGNLFMFYRRGPHDDSEEWFKQSTDDGATWGSGTDLVDFGAGVGIYGFMDTRGNGVHIMWSKRTSAPSPAGRFNIYYAYSPDGGANWQKRDGTAYTLPIDEVQADLVYDSGADQAYGWDLIVDESGNPHIVFATKLDPNHEFRYAKWTGAAWATYQVTTSAQLYGADLHFYSGGIVLDSSDVSICYLAKKNSKLEIEKWITADSGATWTKAEAITAGSVRDNFRLQVIKNYDPSCRLVWCNGNYAGTVGGLWTGYTAVNIQSEPTKDWIWLV